jgi:catechol-2,3-dioxygenase
MKEMREMHITELRLQTADVEQQEKFYVNKLGLALLDATKGSITLQAGTSRLIFERSEQAVKPLYHFAFNIAENKLASAKAWVAERGVRLSQAHPDDWFSTSWNSHALYFYDPADNVVEFIARHNLRTATAGPFSTRDILCVSEIGLVVEDVPAAASALQARFGLEVYRDMAENFAPLGDELGLFIVVKRGRTWLASDKRSDIFPTAVTIQGANRLSYPVPGLPYTLNVEEA